MRTLAFRITNNEEIERLCESLFYGIRMSGWLIPMWSKSSSHSSELWGVT